MLPMSLRSPKPVVGLSYLGRVAGERVVIQTHGHDGLWRFALPFAIMFQALVCSQYAREWQPCCLIFGTLSR
jgi:hypothetical protein